MGSLLSCLSTKVTSEQTTINISNIRRLDSFKLEKMLNKNLNEIALVVLSSKSEKNNIKYGPNTGDDTKLNDEESTIHGVEGDSIIDLKPNKVDIDEKIYEMEIKISKREPENVYQSFNYHK
jgi:methyl coenzyme M reductase subunit D